MITRTLEGTLDLVRILATEPLLPDEGYLRHSVEGMNARLDLLIQTTEWRHVGENGKDVNLFVLIVEEVPSDLPERDTVE